MKQVRQIVWALALVLTILFTVKNNSCCRSLIIYTDSTSNERRLHANKWEQGVDK